MFLKGKFILCCNPSTRLLKCPNQIGKGEEKASHKPVPVSRFCCALSPCAALAGIPGARRAGHHWSPLVTAGHRWQMGSPSLLQLSCLEKRFRFPWCGTEKCRGKSRALRTRSQAEVVPPARGRVGDKCPLTPRSCPMI